MRNAKTVDEFLSMYENWRKELEILRQIMLSTELEETIKWGTPTYTINNKNVAAIGAFKSYAGLWFFQGALLNDPYKLLINAQEGKTVALRQMRFQSAQEIGESVVKSYVEEAIANQKAGREIIPPRKKSFTIPDELKQAMIEDNVLKKCFESLSHSHKRDYAEYVGEAKRAEIRQKRLQKIIPMLMAKASLNDKYRK